MLGFLARFHVMAKIFIWNLQFCTQSAPPNRTLYFTGLLSKFTFYSTFHQKLFRDSDVLAKTGENPIDLPSWAWNEYEEQQVVEVRCWVL